MKNRHCPSKRYITKPPPPLTTWKLRWRDVEVVCTFISMLHILISSVKVNTQKLDLLKVHDGKYIIIWVLHSFALSHLSADRKKRHSCQTKKGLFFDFTSYLVDNVILSINLSWDSGQRPKNALSLFSERKYWPSFIPGLRGYSPATCVEWRYRP